MEQEKGKKLQEVILGAMTRDEMTQFEADQHRLSSDEQDNLKVNRLIYAREHARRKTALKALAAAEGLRPQRPQGFSGILAQSRIWMTIAATLLLVAGIWWVVRSPEANLDNPLARNLAVIYPAPVQVMGDNSASVQWSAAGKAYREGRYAQAIALFEQVAMTDNSQQAEAMFYAGLSALYAEQYELAVRWFQQVPDGQRKEAANWFTALALLQLKQYDAAKPLLEHLDNSPRAAAAQELLHFYFSEK